MDYRVVMNSQIYLAVNLITLITSARINVNNNANVSGYKNDNDDNKNNINKTKQEKWLVDFIYYDDYQSDSPLVDAHDHVDFCPPVPAVTSTDACAQDSCQSDTDCDESYRCCFNGCAFACLFEVESAAIVDWRKEPRRSRSGISWLLDGSSSKISEAEPCSTAPVATDEDPLLCPHGYVCHVTESVKSKKKSSKQGYCVKQADSQFVPEIDIALTSPLRGSSFCNVDKVMLLEGATIRLKGKACRCKKGSLSCWRIKPKTKSKLSKTSKTNKKINKKKNTKTSKKSSRKTRRSQRRINNKLGKNGS